MGRRIFWHTTRAPRHQVAPWRPFESMKKDYARRLLVSVDWRSYTKQHKTAIGTRDWGMLDGNALDGNALDDMENTRGPLSLGEKVHA